MAVCIRQISYMGTCASFSGTGTSRNYDDKYTCWSVAQRPQSFIDLDHHDPNYSRTLHYGGCLEIILPSQKDSISKSMEPYPTTERITYFTEKHGN